MEEDKTKKIYTIDTIGYFCPIPIIKLSEKIKEVEVGSLVKLLSDDPAVLADVSAWCKANGQKLVGHQVQKEVYILYIEKIK